MAARWAHNPETKFESYVRNHISPETNRYTANMFIRLGNWRFESSPGDAQTYYRLI